MNINIEDLPEPYLSIAELSSIEVALEIAKRFGGEQLYFMKYENLELKKRHQAIIDDFNGYNFRALAKKYRLSVRSIQRIVAPIRSDRQASPIKGQLGLFDDDTEL